MTDLEQENFEAELRRINPAKPPEEFVVRLTAMKPPVKTCSHEVRRPVPAASDFVKLLRWLIPATAVVLAAAIVWRSNLPSASQQAIPATGPQNSIAATPALKADEVQIGQELVSSFDAVARLPGGEPVRFRCEKWMDQVVVSDKTQGLVVANRTPRFEVVPVGFETY